MAVANGHTHTYTRAVHTTQKQVYTRCTFVFKDHQREEGDLSQSKSPEVEPSRVAPAAPGNFDDLDM